MSEIADKVKEVIKDQLDVEDSALTDDASIIEDLGADSLDQAELVMALEDAFGVEISDKDAEQIATVGSAIKFVEEKSAEK